MKDIDPTDVPAPMIRQEQQFQPGIIATWAGVFDMLRKRCPDNKNLMRIAQAAQKSGDLNQIAAHGSAEDLRAAVDDVLATVNGLLPPPDMTSDEINVEATAPAIVSDLRERVEAAGVLVPNSMAGQHLPGNNAAALKAYGHLSTEDLVAKVREFDERSRAGEPLPQIAREPQAEDAK